ncbi:MAG TPA: hypothetical protein VGY97_11465 [Solirubrobacteraceae bacterium]|nr:hypothetical protein [Solirubrobacteraceae bacterium]
MSEPGTRPWWAEVEHLRERIERRHGAEQPQRAARRRSLERSATAGKAAGSGPAEGATAARHPAEIATAARHPPRRTVVIRGQAIPTVPARPLVEIQRRRPPARPSERLPGHPDRIAMWAVMLGMLLVAVAALTGHA